MTGKRKTSLPFLRKGGREDPGIYRLMSLAAVSEKIMEQILQEDMLKQMRDEQVIRDSQHGFTRGR